jgi:hypothetical protein
MPAGFPVIYQSGEMMIREKGETKMPVTCSGGIVYNHQKITIILKEKG